MVFHICIIIISIKSYLLNKKKIYINVKITQTCYFSAMTSKYFSKSKHRIIKNYKCEILQLNLKNNCVLNFN